MKNIFEEPACEVVRFQNNDVIVTSSCNCLLPEFPEIRDEIICPHDHPECFCSDDESVNCTKPTA